MKQPPNKWWIYPEDNKLCYHIRVEPEYGSQAIWIRADTDHIEWDETTTQQSPFRKLITAGHGGYTITRLQLDRDDVWDEILNVRSSPHKEEFSLFLRRAKELEPNGLVLVLWRKNPNAWRDNSVGFARVELADDTLRERFLAADWHGIMQIGQQKLRNWHPTENNQTE